MKTAVVIGSTGLIGQQLIHKLAQDGAWSNILAIARTPFTWTHPKIRTLVFDFNSWDNLDLQIKSFAGMTALDFFCSLGTTISKAGSEEKFKQIDYEAVIQFSKMAIRCSAENLLIVSALGADEKSTAFYNRTKGEMERDVQKLGIKSVYFLRPSLLLGDRNDFRFAERLAILLSPIYSPLLIGSLKKYRPVLASSVAKTMATIASKKIKAPKFIENEMLIEFGAK
ncbi:MAG: oxidoreductase [Pseudobdellovibrio sp.]